MVAYDYYAVLVHKLDKVYTGQFFYSLLNNLPLSCLFFEFLLEFHHRV